MSRTQEMVGVRGDQVIMLTDRVIFWFTLSGKSDGDKSAVVSMSFLS